MKKNTQKTKLDLFEGIFSQDKELYARAFYFFGTFACLLVFFAFLAFFIAFVTEKTESPKDVLITNVKSDSVTISWKTDQKTKGLVIYADSATPRLLRPIALLSLPSNNRVFEQPFKPGQYHTITLNRLSKNTAYLYRISTGLHTYKIDAAGKLLPAIKTKP